MAYNVSVLLSENTTTDGDTFTTSGSISPADQALLIAVVTCDRNAANADIVALSGGGMAAWDIIENTPFDGTSTARLHFFRAMEDTPGSGTLTIDAGGITHQNYSIKVLQITEDSVGMEQGDNGANAIVQIAEAAFGTSSTPTCTFGAATNSGNLLIATCYRTASNQGITGPTSPDWTVAGSDVQLASPTGNVRTVYFIGADDNTNWTISGSPTTHAILQIEVQKTQNAAPKFDNRYQIYGNTKRRSTRRMLGTSLWGMTKTADEPLPNAKARVSGFEFETPQPSRARISGFELEAPDAPVAPGTIFFWYGYYHAPWLR